MLLAHLENFEYFIPGATALGRVDVRLYDDGLGLTAVVEEPVRGTGAEIENPLALGQALIRRFAPWPERRYLLLVERLAPSLHRGPIERLREFHFGLVSSNSEARILGRPDLIGRLELESRLGEAYPERIADPDIPG